MVKNGYDIENIHSPKNAETQQIWDILGEVYDPEVPVLSILDLGIVRDIQFDPLINSSGGWDITITPTYSGCPAMDVINMNIRFKLIENGILNFRIRQVLSPAWTTDWMTETGKQNLKAYGIAPPTGSTNENLFGTKDDIECPRCRSKNTKLISEFGSTACKALYQCNDCKEPFDYFKCH